MPKIKKIKEEVKEVLPVEEEKCVDCKPIDKLTGIGGNEDFNKVVEKINELVDKVNDSI